MLTRDTYEAQDSCSGPIIHHLFSFVGDADPFLSVSDQVLEELGSRNLAGIVAVRRCDHTNFIGQLPWQNTPWRRDSLIVGRGTWLRTYTCPPERRILAPDGLAGHWIDGVLQFGVVAVLAILMIFCAFGRVGILGFAFA